MSDDRITRTNMFEPLLAADPTFVPLWQEFLADWTEEADPPLYLALGSLAEHLMNQLKAGKTGRFGAIFAVVERWHTEGDAYVSEAASMGLLESLQGLSGGNDRKSMTVEPCLGKETKLWWDKLDRFWGGDARALRFDT